MTSQISLFEAQTIPPHNGTATSVEAAREARKKVSPQKRRILGYLEFPMFRGYTQDQIAQALDLPRSTVCARFNELERDGLIEKNGETRPSRFGGKCAVYVLASNAGQGPAGSPADGYKA